MLLSILERQSGLSRSYLERLARRATHMYKTYDIPKRTGGWRRIEHPARELKLLQRLLVLVVWQNLPVHPRVFSYRHGVSLRQHAEQHAAANYLLRIDFRNFFPSITRLDLVRVLQESHDYVPIPLDQREQAFIARVACRHDALTIGAPSSPCISNAVMFDLDAELEGIAHAASVTYSRYADDLYFSTDHENVLSSVHKNVKDLLDGWSSPTLEVNPKKTVYTSRKRRRMVTGVSLTSDRKISLGRGRKRTIRAKVHRATEGHMSPEEMEQLRGWIAWAESVEPEFVGRLRIRYSRCPIF